MPPIKTLRSAAIQRGQNSLTRRTTEAANSTHMAQRGNELMTLRNSPCVKRIVSSSRFTFNMMPGDIVAHPPSADRSRSSARKLSIARARPLPPAFTSQPLDLWCKWRPGPQTVFCATPRLVVQGGLVVQSRLRPPSDAPQAPPAPLPPPRSRLPGQSPRSERLSSRGCWP